MDFAFSLSLVYLNAWSVWFFNWIMLTITTSMIELSLNFLNTVISV